MAAVLDRPVTAPTYPEPEGPKLTRERLRALRMMLGLRLEQMAPKLGYSWQHLGAIERGETPMPDEMLELVRPIVQARIHEVERFMEGLR